MKKYWVILCVLFIWACGKENSFKGKEYIYQTPGGFQITLGFDENTNRYFGKGVNQYFGTYFADKNKISFHTPSSTMMMGNRKNMAEEDAFLDSLIQIQSYEFKDDDLILITKDKKRFVLTHKKYSYSKDVSYEK